jgi:hypothetical protein
MSSHRVKYLRLIEAEATRRGNLTNWVPFALEAAPFIVNERHAEEAAELFLRWLFGEPLVLLWDADDVRRWTEGASDSSAPAMAA